MHLVLKVALHNSPPCQGCWTWALPFLAIGLSLRPSLPTALHEIEEFSLNYLIYKVFRWISWNLQWISQNLHEIRSGFHETCQVSWNLQQISQEFAGFHMTSAANFKKSAGFHEIRQILQKSGNMSIGLSKMIWFSFSKWNLISMALSVCLMFNILCCTLYFCKFLDGFRVLSVLFLKVFSLTLTDISRQ